MADSAQEKTEQPTGKKISEARKKGNIPKSMELNSVVLLLGCSVVLYSNVHIIHDHFRQMLDDFWVYGIPAAVDNSVFDSTLLVKVFMHAGAMMAPVLLTALIVGIGGHVVQMKGVLFSPEAIQPSFGKLNPISGLKRLVSLRSLVELGKALIKFVVIGFIVYSVIKSEQDRFPLLIGQELTDVMSAFGSLIFKVVIRVALAMLLLSILDFYYQRWQYYKDLRMTKQEVKEEAKQTEGNPQVKSRIRAIQRSLVRQRMMAQVPKATVVITNPTHYAVALLYTPDMEAPKLLAKGMNLVAKNIIRIARENRVPVHQNPPLARALYKEVKLEETIPVTLYRAVAKVLAYIYQQKSRAAG